jgi:hypothetical protein
MMIPSDADEREMFYLDLVEKCYVSQDERKGDYVSLRSYFLFGSGPEESPAHYNKIYPHIDQLVAFLYSADQTRFSIAMGASVKEAEHAKVPVLTQALNDEWSSTNADNIFSMALTWSLVFGCTFVKLVRRPGGVAPYMVDPGSMGVLREDIPYTDRQEAVCQTYYITRSELARNLYRHPNRDRLMRRITESKHKPTEIPNAVNRIIMSQSNPTIYGNVNLDLSGVNRMRPVVAEDTIEMRELYVYNDETHDYQIVTIAEPGVVIYDRPLWDEDVNKAVFLKGELPFIHINPNPQYDYYWGQSEVSRLVYLQEMRNKRMSEILDLLSKQVNPPTALMGFTGILDEKNFALNRAGGLISTDMPNSKVEKLAPTIPQDLYKEITEIDAMFAEASGISSILAGRGESGVRSSGHASQLARMGSSRAKKRALVAEDALEKMATLYLRLKQIDDNTVYRDANGVEFIADQFTKDFVVKVDAHSNSPIFMEDLRTLAFNLFKAGAIDKGSLLDMLEPPMKQMLKDNLKKMEAKAASQPPHEGGAKLKQVK